MLTTELVQAYDRDAHLLVDPVSELDQQMEDARMYSARFGEFLFDRLADPTADLDIADKFWYQYAAWTNRGLVQANSWVNNNPDTSDDKLQASTELNFNRLNAAMLNMWIPLIYPDQFDDQEVRRTISISQDKLALWGLNSYIARDKIAGQDNDYKYFSPENAPFRDVLEGIVNEFDTAIVLLEVMRRHPEITVVPAPKQFERKSNSHNGKKPNADFVVVSKDGRAIGVQVKSTVRSGNVQAYDPDRIVLVDCKIDLGNEQVRRTKPGKSEQSVQTWAGIVSAQRVQRMKFHGARQSIMSVLNVNEQTVVRARLMARDILQTTRSRTDEAVRIVGDRVLTHL